MRGRGRGRREGGGGRGGKWEHVICKEGKTIICPSGYLLSWINLNSNNISPIYFQLSLICL